MKAVRLKLENVTKEWRGFALKNINLTVGSGEYCVLLGPTGAGKTMLLEIIMGFNKPDMGKVFLDDVDITELAPENRNIGYVPQSSILFPHMTVRENISFGLKMRNNFSFNSKKRKASQDTQKQVVDQVIELTKLKSLENRLPATLSGGEKQKVALARVLAIDPKIILLDEPLASIDTSTARELRAELKRIHREQGKTIIHVTHSLVEGLGLADKVAIINAGEISQVGKAKELFAKPNNEFVAKFLGYENIFKAKIIHSEQEFSLLDVQGLQVKVSGNIHAAEMIAVRPEDITVELFKPKNASLNIFSGTVVECEDTGPLVLVTVDAGLMFKASINRNMFIEKEFEVGKKVWLYFSQIAILAGSTKELEKTKE